MPGFRFTAWPEMIVWPYLLLQGWLPYRDIAIAHNPLLIFDLAIFYKIFGVGIVQLRIYTLLLILLTIFILYEVAKSDLKDKQLFFLIFLYLLLVIVYEGNGLWFDLALAPFSLLLYLFLKKGKNFLAGIVFGLGFLIKQTFFWFLLAVFFFLLKNKFRKVFLFFGGLCLVFFIFFLYLLFFGILYDYFQWAIEFGSFYLPRAQGQLSFPSLKSFVFAILPFALFKGTNLELFLFALAGSLGVYPRWELFHFQPALPFFSLAILNFFNKEKSKIIKALLCSLLLAFFYIGAKKQVGNEIRFYEEDVKEVVKEVEGVKSDSIFVANYWDHIYALSKKEPAIKPLVPFLPWYLDYKNIKEEVIKDLKISLPKVIVVYNREKLGWEELEEFIKSFYSCKDMKSRKGLEFCVID